MMSPGAGCDSFPCRRASDGPCSSAAPSDRRKRRVRCTVSVPVLSLCAPAGTFFSNNECVQPTTFEPTGSCPPGFEAYQNHCRREILHPSTGKCPPGMAPTGNNSCIHQQVAEAKMQCPAGYQMVQGACVNHQAVAPTLSCQA